MANRDISTKKEVGENIYAKNEKQKSFNEKN